MKAVALLALACLCAGAAGANDTVYRCGPDGREYGTVPCAGGSAVPLDAAPSEEQRRSAEAAARREARLAQQLAQERHARESQAGAPAIRIGPAATSAPAPSPTPKKKRKKNAPIAEDDRDGRVAHGPAPGKPPR